MLGLASNYPSGGALSPLWAGPEYLPVRTQARTLSKLQVATGAVLHGHDARTTAGFPFATTVTERWSTHRATRRTRFFASSRVKRSSPSCPAAAKKRLLPS